ncbi:MAG: helix-hairpin-helix domain-containing protein, partial [candidate division WOR-3 bacterium]
MKNKELVEIFNRLADALEFKGENPFRVNAYRKAARVLDELVEDVEILNQEDRLKNLPGIGEGLAKKIDEYLKTGKMRKYEEAIKGIPASLLDLLNIQNVGPKTLAQAYKKLRVKNLDDLKKVISNGRLARLPQMGEKKVENIKRGIEIYEQNQMRLSIFEAMNITNDVIAYLKKSKDLIALEPAGSLRRWKETVGDIDILVSSKKGPAVVEYFVNYPQTIRVLAQGDTKGSIVVKGGRQVDIRIVPPDSYGSALQYFTGSKAHNIKLRDIAKARGLKLNEYGLFRILKKGEKKIAGQDEAEVYRALGLAFIPPELREDRGEIELAQKNELPQLIKLEEIMGDLQVHSVYSDGTASLEAIADYARRLGYKYILISDHSKSARYAHGLDEERFLKE